VSMLKLLSRSNLRSVFLLLTIMGLLLNAGFRSANSVAAAQPVADPARAARISATVAALTATAEIQGSVRVIVQLKVPFQPEGRLRAQERQSQRAKIDQVRQALKNRLGSTKALEDFSTIPFTLLEVNATQLALLAADPEVVDVNEDQLAGPSLDISNPLVGAPTAWSLGARGGGQTVAVLDTGVDKNHLFLSGKVVSEACYSTTDVPKSSESTCPGGAASSTAIDSGLPCDPTISICDHGTHVAGIVAGNTLAVSGHGTMSGIAPDATLIAIKVFSKVTSATRCR
jgi:subtilisin